MAALQGDHSLRPLRFSLSNNFSCRSCTVILFPWCLGTFSLFQGCFHWRHQHHWYNMHHMHAPFLRKMALSIIFCTTIETCLLPAVSVVYTCNTCSPGCSGCVFPLSTSAYLIGTTITVCIMCGQSCNSSSQNLCFEMGPHRHCLSSQWFHPLHLLHWHVLSCWIFIFVHFFCHDTLWQQLCQVNSHPRCWNPVHFTFFDDINHSCQCAGTDY